MFSISHTLIALKFENGTEVDSGVTIVLVYACSFGIAASCLYNGYLNHIHSAIADNSLTESYQQPLSSTRIIIGSRNFAAFMKIITKFYFW